MRRAVWRTHDAASFVGERREAVRMGGKRRAVVMRLCTGSGLRKEALHFDQQGGSGLDSSALRRCRTSYGPVGNTWMATRLFTDMEAQPKKA